MEILIAEDDFTSRNILKAVLTKWGYEVIAVVNGNEAWEKLQEPDAPKLAILDWMMPGLYGVEVCRKVRNIKTQEPAYIIILTVRGAKYDAVEGLESGADDFITKPFDNEELHARIRVGERILELQSTLSKRVIELEEALAQNKTLRGLVPICCHCKKIRDDKGYWDQVESYISKHSEAEFSHGICPECMEKYYSDLTKE